MLLGADNLEVLGAHADINHHLVEVAEVDVPLNVQRVLVVGIDGEVLKQQVGVDNAYGVIVETQRDTIGNALDIRRGEHDLAIDDRTRNGPLY